MVNTLRQAIAEAETLPDADQDEIGRKLLSHIAKLHSLRVDVDTGIRSLDAGAGAPLKLEEFLREARRQNGKS